MKFEDVQQKNFCFIERYVRSLKILFCELRKIKEEVNIEIENMEIRRDFSEQKILFLLRSLTSNIYSGCEIINEMLISLYRYDDNFRGSVLANGFSTNFKRVYNYRVRNEEPKNKIYKEINIFKFYTEAERWYVILHDIRTQETHYFIGKLYEKNGDIYYKNENRNGISKVLYTNSNQEIDITVKKILQLVEEFLGIEVNLCKIICQKIGK